MSELTNKQRREIYERRVKRKIFSFLSLNFNIVIFNVKRILRLIEKHEDNIFRNRFKK